MENASTALIIASSMIIAMLIVGVITFMFQTVSKFAQRQVIAENVSEVIQFNQPYLELQSKATYDFSGTITEVPIGATAEDIISIINYTKHVNETKLYRVNFTLILENKKVNLDEITPKKQQEFISQDLIKRETDINNQRLKYKCKLEYDESGIAPRVKNVVVEII